MNLFPTKLILKLKFTEDAQIFSKNLLWFAHIFWFPPLSFEERGKSIHKWNLFDVFFKLLDVWFDWVSESVCVCLSVYACKSMCKAKWLQLNERVTNSSQLEKKKKDLGLPRNLKTSCNVICTTELHYYELCVCFFSLQCFLSTV